MDSEKVLEMSGRVLKGFVKMMENLGISALGSRNCDVGKMLEGIWKDLNDVGRTLEENLEGYWIRHLERIWAGSWIRGFDGILDLGFGLIME